jgi:glutamate synthase (ferredoxin)
LIARHHEYTSSPVAKRVLDNWHAHVPRFAKVMPRDYKRMLEAFARVAEEGLTGDEAAMAAFELNKNDTARVSGN